MMQALASSPKPLSAANVFDLVSETNRITRASMHAIISTAVKDGHIEIVKRERCDCCGCLCKYYAIKNNL